MMYKCAQCGEEFEGAWSDEEAKAEATRNFPGVDFQNKNEADPLMPVIVCDDCYKEIMGPSLVTQ